MSRITLPLQPVSGHNPPMTKLLDRAIEAASQLPADMQDELAHIVMAFIGEDGTHHLTPDEEASFAQSLEQARMGVFASDEDVAAVFARYPK